MTPDGVRGLYPSEYEQFFRVWAGGVALERVGREYAVPGAGALRVLGLADLGAKQEEYDGCYLVRAHHNCPLLYPLCPFAR
jgi:hypothetical protein